MIGLDLHDAIMPPATAKVPSVPHLVFAELRGGSVVSAPSFAATVKNTPRVHVQFEDALQRSTDIGPLIPHEQYNILMPFLLIGSKSKSPFGAGTVKVQGQSVAVALFETTSINLNCDDPVRLFTGVVTAPSTVRAGMTLGDVYAGMLESAFDTGLGVLKSQLLSEYFMKGLSRILGKQFEELMKTPQAKEAIEKAIKAIYDKSTDKLKPSSEVWEDVVEELDLPKHREFL